MNEDHDKLHRAYGILRECLGDHGVWADPSRHRRQCWTRDFGLAIQPLLLAPHPGLIGPWRASTVAGRHLKSLEARQRPDGQVPILFLDGLAGHARFLADKVKRSVRDGKVSFMLGRYLKGELGQLTPGTRDSELLYVVAALEHEAATGTLPVSLLAYYPTVGRATMDGLVTKRVYQRDLPEAIRRARDARLSIAFSEGLLPYFNSRPELGVSANLASQSEGFYSCYFDPRGRISASSFTKPRDDAPTAFEGSSQELWDSLNPPYGPSGNGCYDCEKELRCSTPTEFHYLLCAYGSHNKVPLRDPGVET